MAGDILLAVLVTSAVFVTGYVWWSHFKETRIYYRLWVWAWKRKR
ncbi:hypothetical protein C8D87_104189 [Lentzea atacamensis]|uniref:DUF418 domain-containing protein n=1 Tax=Lentzea atacamensis TaxID=531938 RepID=A0ABX9E7I3_9PSEU|nr:hypothetical protein C8D87_104189 [Lentzea atacamensis]